MLLAQNATISGRLLEDNGEVISGANINLEGTILGAASDRNGLFIITRIPQGTFRIMVSMIGYVPQDTTLIVNAGTDINLGDIILKSSPLQLHPIVVTASKYEQSVQDVPVTIYTVTAKQMELVTGNYGTSHLVIGMALLPVPLDAQTVIVSM